jgi:hypothetical protein
MFRFNRLGGDPFKFLNLDSGGGNGGDSAAPPSDGGDPNAVAEPSVIDIDENALIRVKGSDKPVKYGDHVKGFQSQFTKASQRAAALERQLQAREAEFKRYQQEREQAQRPNSQPDPYAAIEQLQYLSGKDAANLARQIRQDLSQRDQIHMATFKKLQQLDQVLNGLTRNQANTAFENKISKWLSEGGYGEEYADFAKELYVAYEGDDLDEQFPSILKSRVDQLRKAITAETQAKLRQARPNPFVPGKGGVSGPSKPLEFKGNESAKEMADRLFDTFRDTET